MALAGGFLPGGLRAHRLPAGQIARLDIRQHGSGNIGATNVWRVMGRNWGLVAFACDFLKGFLPLYLLRTLGFPEGENSWTVALLLVLCGLAAIIGHNYTPWLASRAARASRRRRACWPR